MSLFGKKLTPLEQREVLEAERRIEGRKTEIYLNENKIRNDIKVLKETRGKGSFLNQAMGEIKEYTKPQNVQAREANKLMSLQSQNRMLRLQQENLRLKERTRTMQQQKMADNPLLNPFGSSNPVKKVKGIKQPERYGPF